MSEAARRSAVVAVLGAPNAGKSTLVNALVGAKVSIVTHKVQTTRFRLRGLYTEAETQLVFVDTPGIFEPRKRLERAMVAAAWGTLGDADILCLVYDTRRGEDDPESLAILDGIAKARQRALVVLNKVDLVAKPKLMPLADRLSRHPAVERIFMISALSGDGVDDLRRFLMAQAPAGPWLFPEDELSDLPLRQTAAEITREKLFLQLHDELPYDLTVATDSWEDFKNGAVRIRQTVTVAREGQRRIAIGTGGRTIKTVREAAQRELTALLERPVHLFLEIKVKENWAEDPDHYRAWGLDPKA
jgi:GTP-binding protein Era